MTYRYLGDGRYRCQHCGLPMEAHKPGTFACSERALQAAGAFDPSPAIHEACGFAWAVHDNHCLLNALPFGCPSETTARLAWGR